MVTLTCLPRVKGLPIALAILAFVFGPARCQDYISEFDYIHRWLLYPPPNSAMGVFLALAVPIDSIHHDVSLAYNFEANYDLPSNATRLSELQEQYGYRKRSLRDVGRADAYKMIEGTLNRSGLPGRACLLRAVCEASEQPMFEGLVGQLLNVLLKPSTSGDRDVPAEFRQAEKLGRRGADCSSVYNKCRTSLLGLVTENSPHSMQSR